MDDNGTTDDNNNHTTIKQVVGVGEVGEVGGGKDVVVVIEPRSLKSKKILVVWSCGVRPTMFWAGET